MRNISRSNYRDKGGQSVRSLVIRIGRVIRRVLQMLFTLVLIILGFYIYAAYIEPELLIVKTKYIQTEQIQLNGDQIRIVQFSDVHLGEDYTISHLNRLVDKINSLNPEMIIFTGDLIDNHKLFEEREETIECLSRLKAPLGKYAVYGNHDHGGNGTKRYASIMEAAQFRLLKNEGEKIILDNGEVIHVIGIDDIFFGKVDIEKALEGIDEDNYNLLIAHEPDLADRFTKYPIDLQLSGHSHGGQVWIPFIGAPFTPRYGEKYIRGFYEVEGSLRMKLYVNTGIGTSQLRYRFFNIPEITLIMLENSTE